jgi:hypothetical protein
MRPRSIDRAPEEAAPWRTGGEDGGDYGAASIAKRVRKSYVVLCMVGLPCAHQCAPQMRCSQSPFFLSSCAARTPPTPETLMASPCYAKVSLSPS